MSKDPFVRRTVEVDGSDVACRFFKPQPDRGDFFCRFEIDWPEGTASRNIYGVDEVQALLLAIQTVHGDLLIARDNYGRRITFLGKQRLHMPIAETLRDLDVDDVGIEGS